MLNMEMFYIHDVAQKHIHTSYFIDNVWLKYFAEIYWNTLGESLFWYNLAPSSKWGPS